MVWSRSEHNKYIYIYIFSAYINILPYTYLSIIYSASPEKDSEFTRKSRGGGVAGIARASNSTSRSSAAARGR